jgi:nitrogen-specific signal transduction histidine kinase
MISIICSEASWGRAELLSLKLSNERELTQYTDLILNTADRAADLTGKLLSFSRSNPKASTELDVHEIIQATVVLLETPLTAASKSW